MFISILCVVVVVVVVVGKSTKEGAKQYSGKERELLEVKKN